MEGAEWESLDSFLVRCEVEPSGAWKTSVLHCLTHNKTPVPHPRPVLPPHRSAHESEGMKGWHRGLDRGGWPHLPVPHGGDRGWPRLALLYSRPVAVAAEAMTERRIVTRRIVMDGSDVNVSERRCAFASAQQRLAASAATAAPPSSTPPSPSPSPSPPTPTPSPTSSAPSPGSRVPLTSMKAKLGAGSGVQTAAPLIFGQEMEFRGGIVECGLNGTLLYTHCTLPSSKDKLLVRPLLPISKLPFMVNICGPKVGGERMVAGTLYGCEKFGDGVRLSVRQPQVFPNPSCPVSDSLG